MTKLSWRKTDSNNWAGYAPNGAPVADVVPGLGRGYLSRWTAGNRSGSEPSIKAAKEAAERVIYPVKAD